MTKNLEPHYTENVQEHLQQVQSLLDKHALVEMLARKQEMPRQERHELLEAYCTTAILAELQDKLGKLHSSDIAFILEALPIEQRLLVWDLVKADRDGEILIEVSDSVRESLIATMSPRELARGGGAA